MEKTENKGFEPNLENQSGHFYKTILKCNKNIKMFLHDEITLFYLIDYLSPLKNPKLRRP